MRLAIPTRPLWPLKNSQSANPRGPGDGLHPPGDLRLRPPEHLLPATNPLRPDGGKRGHGGGGDGHHGALGLGVGLGADHGDAAAAVVPALHVAPGEGDGFRAAQAGVGQDTATRATSNLAPSSAACSGVSKPRPRLRGWTAVSRITASTSAVRAPDWRWGLGKGVVPILSERRARLGLGRATPASPIRALSRWPTWPGAGWRRMAPESARAAR